MDSLEGDSPSRSRARRPGSQRSPKDKSGVTPKDMGLAQEQETGLGSSLLQEVSDLVGGDDVEMAPTAPDTVPLTTRTPAHTSLPEEPSTPIKPAYHRPVESNRTQRRVLSALLVLLLCGIFLVIGWVLGSETSDSGSSDRCANAPADDPSCHPQQMMSAVDKRKTLQLYDAVKRELTNSADSRTLVIDAYPSMLNWTEKTSAGVFNAWARAMRRPDNKVVLKNATVELRESDAGAAMVYCSGMSNQFSYTLAENITFSYSDNILSIHAEAFSPAGVKLDISTITGVSTVWEDYVGDQDVLITSDEQVSLLAPPDECSAASQETAIKTTLPASAAIDSVSFMNPGNSASSTHLKVHEKGGRFHALSSDTSTTPSLPLSGSLTKNGVTNVNLETTAVPGPIQVAGVRLSNMALQLTTSDLYTFKATAEFHLGRHDHIFKISGHVGYQPKKDTTDAKIHDIELDGILESTLVEGSKTRITAKPLRIQIGGFLQAGLPACDAATKALGPCVELTMPESPSIPAPSTIGFDATGSGAGDPVQYARWQCSARVSGVLDFGFGRTQFDFPLGHQADMFGTGRMFEFNLSDIDIGSNINLHHGRVKWNWPDALTESAEISFKATIATGTAPLEVDATGSLMHGALHLAGGIKTWTFPIGATGLTVSDAKVNFDVEWDESSKRVDRCKFGSPIPGAIDHKHNLRCPSLDENRQYSLDKCMQVCDEDPTCMSLEYQENLGVCCLLDCHAGSGCVADASMSGMDSKTYDCTSRDPQTGFVGPVADMSLTGFNDLGIFDAPGGTLDECAAKCRAIANCTSFDFGRADSSLPGSCYLSTSSRHDVPASFEAWPGYDYYEVPTAAQHATQKDSDHYAISKIVDPQVHNANVTKAAKNKWKFEANSTVAFGGGQWDFSFGFSSRQTEGLFARLTPTGPQQNLEHLVAGIVGANVPLSDPDVAPTTHLNMVPTMVRLYTKPLWLRATVNHHVTSTLLPVHGILSVRETASGWKWGVVLQTEKNGVPTGPNQHPDTFALSALVPESSASGAFSGLRLSHGVLGIANSDMNLTVAPGIQGFQDLPAELQVKAGVTVGATIQLVDVAPIQSMKTGQVHPYIRVYGHYRQADGPSKMTLVGQVKGPLAMTRDIDLDEIKLMLMANGAGHTSAVFSGKATLNTPNPGHFTVNGNMAISNTTQSASVSGAVSNWKVTKDITVASGNLDISLERSFSKMLPNETAAWGAWKVSGAVSGTVQLYGMDLTLKMPIPLDSGITTVSADMPYKQLAPGVALVDVKTDGSFAGDLDSLPAQAAQWDLTATATLRFNNPMSPTGQTDVAVSGKISPSGWDLKGEVTKIVLAQGVSFDNLKFTVAGNWGGKTSGFELKAGISCTAEVMGKVVDVTGSFMKNSAGMKVTGDIQFPSDDGIELPAPATAPARHGQVQAITDKIKFDKMDFTLEEGILGLDGAVRITSAPEPLNINVTTVIRGPTQVSCESWKVPTWMHAAIDKICGPVQNLLQWQSIELKGSVSNWQVASAVRLQLVELDLSLLRSPDSNGVKKTTVEGHVAGEVVWSGLTLGARIPIPVSAGDTTVGATAQRLDVGASVTVDDLDVQYKGTLTSFLSTSDLTAKGTVRVATPFAPDPELVVKIDGSMSSTAVSFRGSVANWHVAKGFVVTNVAVSVDAEKNPTTGPGCVEVKVAEKGDCDTSSWFCTNKTCAVDCAGGVCSSCGTVRQDTVADPKTGRCVPALCYEALRTDFSNCEKYVELGYTCIGDQCARDGCNGDCQICAHRKVGLVLDAATGKCKTPWELKSAKVDAQAALLGKDIGYMSVQLPWKDGHFEIEVSNLELASSTTLSGKLVVQSKAPQMSLNGSVSLGNGADFDVATVLSNTDTAQSAVVKGSAKEWKVGSKFTIDRAAVDLTFSRTKDANNQWSALDVRGSVLGDFTAAGMVFDVDVPVPISSGVVTIDGDLPAVDVAPGVNLEMSLSGAAAGSNLTQLLANAELDVTGTVRVAKLSPDGNPATASLTGKFGKNVLTLTGNAANWEIVPGMVLHNLVFDVSSTGGTFGSTKADVAVGVSATFDSVLGAGTAVSAKFKKTANNKPMFEIAMTGPFAVGGVNLKSLDLKIPGDGTAITFAGAADLPAYGGGAPGAFDVSGTYLATALEQSASFQGEVSAWQATKGVTINNVKLDLEISKELASGTVTTDGEVSGDFVFAGTNLIATVPIPLDSGDITAEIPILRLSPGVRLIDLKLVVGKMSSLQPGVSADVTGKLNVSTPTGPQSSVQLDVQGKFGNGAFDVAGSLSEWEIVDGLLLKGLQFTAAGKSGSQGMNANVTVQAQSNLFGLEANMWAAFGGGGGHKFQLDGNIDFPNGDLIDFLANKVKKPNRALAPLAQKEGLELGTMNFKFKNNKLDFNMSAKLHGGPTPAQFACVGFLEGVKVSLQNGVQWEKKQHAVISGGVETWQLSSAIAVENVKAELDILKDATSTNVTGSVMGTVTMGGIGLDAYVPVPISSGPTSINVSLTDVGIGGLKVRTGTVNYQGTLSDFTNTANVKLDAIIDIDTSFAVDPKLSFTIDGDMKPDKIFVKGSTATWRAVDGFTLDTVKVDAEITKAAGDWSVWGLLEAEGSLLGGKVKAATPFPWQDGDGLTVDVSELTITKGVTITKGQMTVRKTSPQFEFDAQLAMGTANSLHIAGTAGSSDELQEMLLKAHLNEQTWEVAKDVVLNNIHMDLTVRRSRAQAADPWSSWEVVGVLEGGLDWGGVTVYGFVPLPLDDKTVLNASFAALNLGGVVAFQDARIEYRGDISDFARNPRLEIGAMVNVSTPFADSEWFSMDVAGRYTKTEITMTGSVNEWHLKENVLSLNDIYGTFTTGWNADQASVATSNQTCYEADTTAYPNCVSWNDAINGFKCVGTQCARDGCAVDAVCEQCAVSRPGMVRDPQTATCVDALCYETVLPGIDGCDYGAYHCAGKQCAVDGCVGDCEKCAMRKPGFVADPATGMCSLQVCYEATKSAFATCDHAALGYTCVGDNCVLQGACGASCQHCGVRKVGFIADFQKGVCAGGKWELTAASAKATATVLGTKLAGVNWEFGEGIEIDISGLKLGEGIEVTKGIFRMKKGEPITFSAHSDIRVGQTVIIQPELDGIVHSADHFAINGSLKTGGWDVQGVAVREVSVKLECKKESGKMGCAGDVFGRLELWENQVEISVPVPFNSGDTTVYMPRMVFGPGTYLENTLLKRTSDNEFSITGNLSVSVSDKASNLVMAVAGTVSKDCFQVAGSTLEEWRWDVAGGITVKEVKGDFTLGKACPGAASTSERVIYGSISGSVDFAGGNLAASYAFGPDKGHELVVAWEKGPPPTLLAVADGFTSVDMNGIPGKGSVDSVNAITDAGIQDFQLTIRVKEAEPTIWVRGSIVVFNGKKVDLVAKFGTVPETHFIGAVEVPAGTVFSDIESSQGSVSSTLGPLKAGHLAVATGKANFTLNDGKVIEVSAGVNFRTVIDMSNLGGKLGAGSSTATPSELEITGYWADLVNVGLKADLRDFPLGDHVLLSAMLEFKTSEPIFSAEGEVTTQLSSDMEPFRALARVDIWRGGDLDIHGRVQHWRMDIGHSGLLVEDLALNISKRGSDFRASLLGVAFFNMSGSNRGVGRADQSAYRVGKSIAQNQRPCVKDHQGNVVRYAGECAFDGDANTLWDTTGDKHGDTQWLRYSYEKPRRLISYTVLTTKVNCPAAWVLQGSNIEGHWVTVDSRTGERCNEAGQKYDLPVGESRSFRHFRFSFMTSYTANVESSGYRIREIQMGLWDNAADYVMIAPDTTCTLAGFPPTSSNDQCVAAQKDLGFAASAGPLATPGDLSHDSPAGCYVDPGVCAMGWLDAEYGYQPAGTAFDLDGNQPLQGLTLMQCVAACEANPACRAISRSRGADNLPGDCYLKKTLLPKTDGQLKHTAACLSTDEVGVDCAGLIGGSDAGRGGLNVEQWCTGNARPDNQIKEGLKCSRTCCEYWADKGTATCHGTANGRPCKFPFEHNGTQYSACTPDATSGMPFCKTVGEGDLWGNCNCGPRYGTYVVRCPEAGYKLLGDTTQTCSAMHMSVVSTLDWCTAASEALGLGSAVTTVTEESSAPGCQQRASGIVFNTAVKSTENGASNGAKSICHSGPSLWFNDISAGMQGGGIMNDDLHPICGSDETRVGMLVDIDVAGKDVNLTLRVKAGQSLTPSAACMSMAHPTAVSDADMPSDFSSMLEAPMLDASLFLSTSPPTLDIRATMSVPRLGMVHGQLLIVRAKDTGMWHFALGIVVNEPFTFDEMAPTYGGKAPDYLNFARGSFVVSSFHHPYTFMGESVTNGVALSAYINLKANERLQAVRSWTGVDEVMVRVSFGFAAKVFRFEGAIYGRWYIIKPELSVTGGRLFVEAGNVPGGVRVGMGIDLDVVVSQQTLEFTGELILSPINIEFGARMLTEWHSPFGMKSLKVLQTEAALGIQYTCPEFSGFPCPSKIGLGGGLDFMIQRGSAGIRGSAAVVVNKLVPSESLFAFSLDMYTLDEMNEDMAGGSPNPFGFFQLQGLSVSVNPSQYPKEFNGNMYKPGIHATIKEFQAFGELRGSGSLSISPTIGIAIEAKVYPIDLFSGIVKLHGTAGETEPAQLALRLNAVDPLARVDGMVQLFGQKFGMYLNLDKSSWDLRVTMELLGGMLRGGLDLHADVNGGIPNDFSAAFLFEQDIMEWLAENVQKFMEDLKKQVNAKMDEAQTQLDEWLTKKKPQMEANNKEIQRIRDEHKAGIDKAKAWLDQCKAKVDSARKTVQGWQDTIDRTKAEKEKVSCSWWKGWVCAGQIARNAGRDIKIAAYWVAKKAADGALWIADKALDLAKSGLTAAEKIANVLDPRVLKLQAENTAINALYKICQVGIEAARAVVNGAADLVSFAFKALAELFNVKRIACKMDSLLKKPSVACDFAGTLLGMDWSMSFSSSFPPKLEDLTDAVKDSVRAQVGL